MSKGFVVIVPVVIIVLVVWFFVAQWQKAEAHRQAFNSWTTDCYDLGGEIKTSGAGVVDCFVENNPCRIGGYEKFEVVNQNPYFRNLEKCVATQSKEGE